MTLPMNQHTSRSPKGSLRDKLTAEAWARTRYAQENEFAKGDATSTPID
jgi:hypothetical protein